MADDCAEVIDLPPLTMAELTALAEKYAGDLIDQRSLELLLSASEGNPLWATEILAANQRTGGLRRAGGVWTIDDFGALSVRELLRERVRAWTPGARSVASMVAAGGLVPVDLLLSLCGRASVHEARLAGALQNRDVGLIELSHPQLSETVLAMEEPSSRTRNLLALVNAAEKVSGEWFMLFASSLLELGTFRAANADLLVAAARQSFDGTHPPLAQQLIEAAVRAGRSGQPGSYWFAWCFWVALKGRPRWPKASPLSPHAFSAR